MKNIKHLTPERKNHFKGVGLSKMKADLNDRNSSLWDKGSEWRKAADVWIKQQEGRNNWIKFFAWLIPIILAAVALYYQIMARA
jgi:hypothetical protein